MCQNLGTYHSDRRTVEYFGFNTKKARDVGQSLKLNTKNIYLPLIDVPPTDPSTMMAALEVAFRLTD